MSDIWVYEMVDVVSLDSWTGVVDALNAHGKFGWEICHVFPALKTHTRTFGDTRDRLILQVILKKREDA